MISIDDFVLFCNRTLDGYERAVARIDDSALNRAPVAGANTPAQLVVHAMGAAQWWTAGVVAGRPVERDRDAEFAARASRRELLRRVAGFRSELDGLRTDLAAATDVTLQPSTQMPLGQPWTVGTALIHAYEELAQHLGHLELTADILAAPA